MASAPGATEVPSSQKPGFAFPGLSGILLVATAALMLVNLYLIFLVAPTDAVLGEVQRIFYFHVPIAIVSFVAFFVVFVASIGYLVTRKSRWDSVAHAAAEVGVVFVSLALLTGIVWARPVWGVWWTWEPRLTTTLILWLIYVAYLMLRSYVPNKSQGALYAA
ncbi:MAG: cytochrome c biogenesis protein, partial [Chloroflexota bacterium]|nr:cytochrome c biogenesis protein [Chloroflexota bacterium]